MDEGLLFVLIVPTFVIILPISISSLILYFVVRDIKKSIIYSIIGFIGAAIIGYGFQVFPQIGQMFGPSPFTPFLILILSSILTAYMGLNLIKMRQRK